MHNHQATCYITLHQPTSYYSFARFLTTRTDCEKTSISSCSNSKPTKTIY